MPIRRPVPAATYGVDLGKTRFDVIATDAAGMPVQRLKLSRDTILRFFESAPAALIGMEACPGAQWLARKLAAFGHTVRIIPAQFVKPFVKSNKNDARDAEAIAEAVRAADDALCGDQGRGPGRSSSASPGPGSYRFQPHATHLPDARVLP